MTSKYKLQWYRWEQRWRLMTPPSTSSDWDEVFWPPAVRTFPVTVEVAYEAGSKAARISA